MLVDTHPYVFFFSNVCPETIQSRKDMGNIKVHVRNRYVDVNGFGQNWKEYFLNKCLHAIYLDCLRKSSIAERWHSGLLKLNLHKFWQSNQ